MQLNNQFKHQNLSDRVADHIAVGVARGELKPGERLYEKEICEALGVSRVPVREAVRLLQAQGLVRSEPNRGTYIAEFGLAQTLELLDIRITIERIAILRLRRDRVGLAENLKTLEARLAHMRRAVKSDDPLDYCHEDLMFHRTLVTMGGSPMVLSLWESLSRFILVFLMNERAPGFRFANSVEDHQRLIEMISDATDDELDAEITRHIKGYVSKPATGLSGEALSDGR
jgi:DNA-binding GntR family transcriptional regulator